MKYVLFILSLLALFDGFVTGASAQSAIHQILGGISYICAAVLFSSACIIGAIQREGRITREARTQPLAGKETSP